MKTIITLIIAMLLSLASTAQLKKCQINIETVTGGFIYHTYFKPNTGREYKTNLKRALVAPMIGLRIVKENEYRYSSVSLFLTENCIGEKQLGLMGSFGDRWKYGKFELYDGIVFGGYTDNVRDWEKKDVDMIPAMIGGCFIPIIGAEFNIRYNITNKCYVTLNNMVSIITHTSISIGIKL